ncbi:MAG: ATP-dependent RNA helicase RhlE [Coriobacteriaceae bacterium]|nr:ATP-dependent RNA helicase RhlE [Coriobacteriaceae bacterium]
MSFDNLGLEPRLLQAVVAMGYTRPTPIQTEAIPLVLAGRDVVGCAQTGTGKTAAFVLPMLQRIRTEGRAPSALVVTPTRELAVQIEEVARDVAKHTGHRVTVVYGGVGYEPQIKALRKGVDLLVATPGRLLDLHKRGDVHLNRVEVLVLDEADRMLDMGFWPDVRRILNLLPPERQNLLFSATMSTDVLRVISSTLHDPVQVSVTPSATPVEAIQQSVYPVGGQQKADLLIKLIAEHKLDRVLVFTRTKHRADRVAKVLGRHGINAAAIHGNRSQSQRQGALDSFKQGRCRVLVATDIVARGIDIDDISHVVNYDIPNTPEDYVHRIGRTARAGKSGSAFTLLAPEEHETLRDIETKIGSVLESRDHDGFDYSHDRIVPNPEREAVRKPRSVFSSGIKGRGYRRGTRRR